LPKTKNAPTRTHAERVQYRVGHGGFHSTIVMPTGAPNLRPLAYIYDVGAKPQKARVRGAIDRYIARLKAVGANKVEFVILSHVDEDHVNCLEHLLVELDAANVVVGTVLLPWLSTTEKLLSKAHANHRSPSTVVMNLTGDDSATVSYLANRGVESEAFLQSEGTDVPPTDIPSPLGPSNLSVRARFVASGTNLTALSPLPWSLVAMRIEPPKHAISHFASLLAASAKLDPNDPTNHRVLLSKHRSKISTAMAGAASSVGLSGYGHSLSNWSSISIFGSSPAPVSAHPAAAPPRGDLVMNCDHGWLHTGDLPLHIPDVWRAFELVWRTTIGNVPLCAVTAPHHGSPNGHNALLYANGFRPQTAIFTTGLSSTSTAAKRIYSHRNSPANAMKVAASTSTVIELHNV
jgi:hypothetical protein